MAVSRYTGARVAGVSAAVSVPPCQEEARQVLRPAPLTATSVFTPMLTTKSGGGGGGDDDDDGDNEESPPPTIVEQVNVKQIQPHIVVCGIALPQEGHCPPVAIALPQAWPR